MSNPNQSSRPGPVWPRALWLAALALGLGAAALFGPGPEKGDAMQNTAPKMIEDPPAIEALQPGDFQTATFGLG